MMTQRIPDSTGTVCVSGHEPLALAYALKDSFMKALAEEADGLRRQLRAIARTAAAEAGPAATAVKRVFVRNGAKGGVSISLPNYEEPGNRLVLSDTKLKEVNKVGDITALPGLAFDALVEETVTDPGGEVIELRGRWVQWFKDGPAGSYLQAGVPDPDLKYEKRDRTTARRLKHAAVAMLRGLAEAGNEVASLLLSLGLKEPSVKAEDK